MARTAGAVSVAFTATDKHFTAIARKVKTRLERLRDQSKRMSRDIKRNWKGAAVGVGALTGAIILAIKKMTDYSSTLVETSRVIGLTTKQLEGMRSLLKGDGIGIAQTDKMMKEFNTRLGLAKRGIGQYTRAFDDMGVSVKNSNGTMRTTNEVFLEVAKKLGEMKDQSEAASLAYELFGRSGKELIPILRNYGGAMGEAIEYANRFRTVTEEQHKANKDLGQEFQNLTDNTIDLVQRALSPMSDNMNKIIDNMNVAIQKMKPIAESFGEVISTIIDGWRRMLVGAGEILGFNTRTAIENLNIAKQDQATHQTTLNKVKIHEAGGDAEWTSSQRAMINRGGIGAIRNRAQAGLTDARGRVGKFQAEVDHANAMQRLIDKSTSALDGEGTASGTSTTATGKPASQGATQFTRSGQIQARAKHFQDLYAKQSADAVLTALMEGAFGEHPMQKRAFDSAGHKRMAYADALSMVGLYHMKTTDSYRLNRGAQLGNFAIDPTIAALELGSGYGPAGIMSDNPLSQFINRADLNLGTGRRAASPNGRAIMNDNVPSFTDYDLGTGRRLSPNALAIMDDMGISRVIGKPKDVKAVAIMDDNSLRRFVGNGQGEMSFGPALAMEDNSPYQMQHGAQGRIYGTKAIARMNEAIEKEKDSMEGIKDITDATRGAFESLGKSIVMNFENAGDAVKNFGKELLGIFAQRMVINPAADLLFGAAGSAGGGLFGSLLSGLFNPFGGGKGIATLADGGFAARGMALVGERGPELVDFSKPGRVYTNEQLSAAMSGGMGKGITIVNNINSTDGPGVERALGRAMPTIIKAAQTSVADQARRPGGFRQAVRGYA